MPRLWQEGRPPRRSARSSGSAGGKARAAVAASAGLYRSLLFVAGEEEGLDAETRRPCGVGSAGNRSTLR